MVPKGNKEGDRFLKIICHFTQTLIQNLNLITVKLKATLITLWYV